MQDTTQSINNYLVTKKHIRSGLLRITHWLNAFLIIAMMLSGWGVYNGAPSFDFRFPEMLTVGTNAMESSQWHFGFMWLLIIAMSIYLAFGIVTGHFRRHFSWRSEARLLQDIKQAFSFKLKYQPGVYNAVQRIAYTVVVMLVVVLILSGIALWQPVQFQTLTLLMGDYEATRMVHFIATLLLVGFTILHLLMAFVSPKAIWAMITGKITQKQEVLLLSAKKELPSTESGDAI